MLSLAQLRRRIKISGTLSTGEPMSRHTSFAIGGPADIYARPAGLREASDLYALCREEGVPDWGLVEVSSLLQGVLNKMHTVAPTYRSEAFSTSPFPFRSRLIFS